MRLVGHKTSMASAILAAFSLGSFLTPFQKGENALYSIFINRVLRVWESSAPARRLTLVRAA